MKMKKRKKIIESGSCRDFFSHVKNKTTNRDIIPPLIMPTEGNFAYSDTQKATLLSNYFCSVFTDDNNILPKFEVPEVAHKNLSIESTNFPEFQVAYKITKLKNSCSPGYDGFTSVPLKRLNHIISKPL